MIKTPFTASMREMCISNYKTTGYWITTRSRLMIMWCKLNQKYLCSIGQGQ